MTPTPNTAEALRLAALIEGHPGAMLRAQAQEIERLKDSVAKWVSLVAGTQDLADKVTSERDTLRMELGDLPEAQAELLATCKAQAREIDRLKMQCITNPQTIREAFEKDDEQAK